MRKLIITTFLLLLALAVSAQSLAGKWSNSRAEADDDLSMAGIERLTIREDGAFDHTMDMDVVMVMDEETTFHITLYVSAPGNWKQEGDMLTFKPNKGKAKAEIVKTDMPGILKAMIANSLKNELLKELKKTRTERIESLTEGNLVLFDPSEKDPAEQRTEYTRVN